MSQPFDLRRLSAFFPPDDIEWKPIAVSKKTGKALAAAYITTRAIMDRLDEVCGPENWRNEFQPGPGGGVLCGIAIRLIREDEEGKPYAEWVTKWDGAENTDVEAVKGGLSGSMKRAASQWGIGRYIYRLPQQWIPVDQYGKFSQQPRIPAQYLPPRTSAPRPSPAPPVENNDNPPPTRANGNGNGRANGQRRSRPPTDVNDYR